MKIFIIGGTGFVGTNLASRLLERGDEVTVVGNSGRSSLEGRQGLHVLQADTTCEGSWQDTLAGYDIIINLAGRTIFSYWTDSYKDKIYKSRVATARNIVSALPENTDAVLLSASAAGYYGESGEVEQDETETAGTDFLANVCRDWENAAYLAQSKGARVATMRFGVVLGKGGGAIETMKTPFKLGMGGPIGDGSQWFPWIHLEDLISATLFIMDGSDLDGPFNFTAPGHVRQKEFAKTLGSVLKRPAFMPAPSFLVKTLAGEFGESLLHGQKVVPKRLQEAGFTFRYPTIEEALQEILG